MTAQELAISILSSITASGILVAILAWLSRNWIFERLKNSIKHEYDTKLERAKKDLEFDLTRKVKIYEGKLSNYKAYLKLLDDFSERYRKELFTKLRINIKDILTENSDNAFLKYIDEVLSLQTRAASELLKFKNEVNGLRLEAGDQLLILLDQYIEQLEVVNDAQTKFFRDVNEKVLSQSISQEGIIEEFENYTNGIGKETGDKLNEIHDAIFLEMRQELSVF